MKSVDYATLDDITALWRAMTPEESQRAQALLPVVSASLRNEARKAGKDLDILLLDDPDLAEVAKSVTVDVVARTLMTSTNAEPMTQLTESLKGLNVTVIEASAGTTFDPNFHNAVMHVEDESLGENVIAEVFQQGFQIGDKVIRHAMVKVAN